MFVVDSENQKPERNLFVLILTLVTAFIGLLILLALLKIAFFTLGLVLWILLNIVIPLAVLGIIGYIIWRYFQTREKKEP